MDTGQALSYEVRHLDEIEGLQSLENLCIQVANITVKVLRQLQSYFKTQFFNCVFAMICIFATQKRNSNEDVKKMRIFSQNLKTRAWGN